MEDEGTIRRLTQTTLQSYRHRVPRLSNSISVSITPPKMLNNTTATLNVKKPNAQNAASSMAACMMWQLTIQSHAARDFRQPETRSKNRPA